MWEFIDKLDKELTEIRENNLREIEETLGKIEKSNMTEVVNMGDSELNKGVGSEVAFDTLNSVNESEVIEEESAKNKLGIELDEIKTYLNAIDSYIAELCENMVEDIEDVTDSIIENVYCWAWEDATEQVAVSAYTTILDEVLAFVKFNVGNMTLWAELRDVRDKQLEYLPKRIVFLNDKDEIDEKRTFGQHSFLDELRSFIDATDRHIENPEEYY